MTSKLHIQSSPSKDDDSYAEDDFEQIDSVGASNKLSPMKKNSKSFEFQTSKEAHLQTNQGLNHNQGKLGDDDDEMSGDLEKYIMEMKINPGPIQVDDNDHEEHAIDVNKVTQSLEGIKPLTENAEHQQLGEKLGYHERPLTHILTQDNTHNTHNTNFDSNHNHTQKHKSPHPKVITHQSPLASKGHKEEEEHEDQVNEAQKVESLLMELFPDKYGKKKSKGKKSGGKHSQQLNSLMGNKLGLFAEEEEDIADQAKDVLSTLEGQLKLLKRELKVKDEKIVKLTEHSMMMANHMDRLKGEIAKLHARLRDAEVEIEVKETRIAELLKSKKKIKKVSQKSSPIAAHDKSLAGIESENIKLREREQALMEAVEELSSQNEDLIVKLRESMQRELELSSKRAALVSHSVMNHNNSSSLPNIHEKDQAYHHQSYGEQRTQSEPSSSDAPLKRGKKVKGRSHY